MSIAERQAELWREHLRLALLRFLADTAGGTLNDSLLTDAVVAIGIDADRHQVRDALVFLARGKCVRLEHVEPIVLASLTDLGEMVAKGRRRVAGVKPPSRG